MKSTILERANEAFSNGDFEIALALYNKVIQENKTLSNHLLLNVELAKERFRKVNSLKNEKIIVYTCNFGNYESVKEPVNIDKSVEYILFTDNELLKSKVWKVVVLKEAAGDSRRTSRLPKILAHKYLPPHDISIYIDSSLEIKESNVKKMALDCLNGYPIALYKHYKRNCVYDEIEFVMNSTDRFVSNKSQCLMQKKKYEQISYPKNNGLFENALIVRRNNKDIEKLNNTWWYEYQEGTERDQFVFMYALHICSITPNAISIGEQFRKNPYVNFYKHKYESYSKENSYVDSKYEKIKELIRRKSVKLVSFDIFDTLISRNVLIPKDIFWLMGKNEEVKRLALTNDFESYRVLAEKQARKKIENSGQHIDPTLEQIYSELSEIVGIDNIYAQKLKQIENEYEVKFCHPKSKIIELLDFAILSGKKVVLCSDMYLPRDTIEKMLKKCGVSNYDKLYLSCEIGLTKKHGTIYPKLINDFKLSPESILQIGDNQKSDIQKSKENGLKAIRVHDYNKIMLEEKEVFNGLMPAISSISNIKNVAVRFNYSLMQRYLFKDSIVSSRAIVNSKDFGYLALGPFLLSLALWIIRTANEKGFEKIYLLARDGYLIDKGIEALREHIDIKFETEYLPISRKALFPYMLQTKPGFEDVFFIKYASDLKVQSFIKNRFGYKVLNIFCDSLCDHDADILNGYMYDYESYVLNKLRELYPQIQKITKKDSDSIESFYKGAIQENTRSAIFDVGRKGTFQRILSEITNNELFGFYIINSDDIKKNAGNKFKSYLGFSECIVRGRNIDTVLYEALLSEKKGSFIGFDENNKPIRETSKGDSSVNMFESILLAQKAALDYMINSANIYSKDIIFLELEGKYASYPLENWMENSDLASIVTSFSHEDSVSTEKARSLGQKSIKKALPDPYYQFPVEKIEKHRVIIYCPAITRIRGGAERIASRVANHLIENGYDVLMLTSGNPQSSNVPLYYLHPTVIVRNVDVRNIDNFTKIIDSYRPNCGLVLASGSVLINIAAAFKRSSVPFMLSERASPAHSLEIYWKDYKKSDYLKVYDSASSISVQFPSFKSFFRNIGSSKLMVLPNPIEIGHDNPAPDHYNQRTIICAARIWFEQKKQDLLLEAFAKCSKDFPDWKLEFYGHGYGNDFKTLIEMSKKLGVENKVLISPAVSNISEKFKKSSIFVLPSMFEGFPNSLAEAMALGLPAIGFDGCPGVNELIVDDVNGFLASSKGSRSDQVSSLSVKLKKMMSDEEMRKMFGENSRKIMSNYESVKVLKAWEESVRSLCALS
ncbi:glycosyltransferase [Halomonas sp.]|uniref:glycosyltransferase n=1 Tax=Halomonas sp. TaxID=1486246 RepID=UPI003F8EED97